jgi:hypothetical protein
LHGGSSCLNLYGDNQYLVEFQAVKSSGLFWGGR